MNLDEQTKIRLESEVNRVHDACKRYESNTSSAIVYHEKDIDLVLFGSFLRKNDKIIKLDNHHHFIMFCYTSESEAYEAAKNLLSKLDSHFQNTTSCIAIDSACKNDSTNMMINKLLLIIKETKKNSVSRIEYDDILDEIV
ncbi:hypothetical protein FJR48_10355 [Sulfurimonas lithotrophica]|uniref:Uncharacterized protein n=1 Tax=Sulfurimonas lithotrophica TaxID=2590022 RepID=A0A5P8P349_9BACT|nr:hypothetical protein [Sulfurimonas lithotrophica]QFR50105.1 hypothetical protein FJR48_10355 [Sulfurimonas lithotrophica]